MKKHFNKTARHGHSYRVGLGIGLGQGYYGSPHYSPYYAYPTVVSAMYKVPTVDIQQGASFIYMPPFIAR
jgi:hypothetical protein